MKKNRIWMEIKKSKKKNYSPQILNWFDLYLCETWVPRRLDIVSSRFCRRSAMFLTVRNRLVSGSSPESETVKRNKLRDIYQRNKDVIKLLRTLCCERSPTWQVLDGELAALGEGNVSAYSSWADLGVRYSLAVCLGSGKAKLCEGSKGGYHRFWIIVHLAGT